MKGGRGETVLKAMRVRVKNKICDCGRWRARMREHYEDILNKIKQTFGDCFGDIVGICIRPIRLRRFPARVPI